MAARKLIVDVCHARNLMPKDGRGSSSAYVQLDFDCQRKRTTAKLKDLNPVWNETLEFSVSNPSQLVNEVLEANVYNEITNGRRSNFLGRVYVFGQSFVKKGEEAMVAYPLGKRGIFSHIKGELALKVYYVDEPPKEMEPQAAEPVPAPPAEALPAPSVPAEGGAPPEQADSMAAQPAHAPEEKPPEVALSPPPAEEPKEEEAKKVVDMKLAEKFQLFRSLPVNPADYLLRDTNPYLAAIHGEKVSTYDLVEKMQYLYVRVVKARGLTIHRDSGENCNAYVRVNTGSHSARTKAISRDVNPEWNQAFAFGLERMHASGLEITVWDEEVGNQDHFLGMVSFDLQEIPTRVPPDSPLAPQWYRLENMRGGGKAQGDIMLAVWMGTQADEAFPDAWQSDTGGYGATRSKVYVSPKLWYLRVNIIEAQDLQAIDKLRTCELIVKGKLGFQILRTRVSKSRSNSPFWNEDMIFVAAEPFEEHLSVVVEDRLASNKDEIIGQTSIMLNTVERRTDHRQVPSRWFNLEKESDEESSIVFRGRIHLRICFDGGYHVMDEAAHLCSDLRPTAKQLWKPALGMLELGILGGQGLLPMKTKDGRGATDAYCVAKYGQKWVRTRTILDNFNPRWNEQYTWEVYDPCTVLTVGVFDNAHLKGENFCKDVRIGKVRVRLSTLDTNRVYTNSYPLLVLHPSGAKKMGELELAVRFSSSNLVNLMQVYSQPMLPTMHYLFPLGIMQQDNLRHTAMKIVALRLSRSEPPLRQEVVQYMLDTNSNIWSMRRCKANWYRIMAVLGGAATAWKWMDDILKWKSPVTTLLVHILYVILVIFPELVLPTLFLYLFLLGGWNFRNRPTAPPHMDARISLADGVDADELEEEFDTVPSSKPSEVVRVRYERLRGLGGRIQTVLGDIATQGERLHALVGWRDPRATSIFITFSLIVALILYLVPTRVSAIILGLYFLRHPRFRDHHPPTFLNFVRRLPSLSDRVL